MTQEYKELLLKDLCARLPYGVKALATQYRDDAPPLKDIVVTINFKNLDEFLNNSDDYDYDIKPYLFPLSSMTEEQELFYSTHLNYMPYYQRVDWFNENHLDYRGLISMGLAVDATGLNIY